VSRLLTIAALVAGVLAVREASPVVMEGLPIGWTHTLNDQCTFDRRPWYRALPMGIRSQIRLRLGEFPSELRDEVLACHVGRGLKSSSPFLKTIRPDWPSDAELTAMESSHANRSFHASPAPRLVPASAGQ
jgi:hypothetical protein